VDFSDIKNKLIEERDSVEKALEKTGDAVKAKFGHDDQVDKGVAAANDYLDRQAATASADTAPADTVPADTVTEQPRTDPV
jgi:hypothetical protein